MSCSVDFFIMQYSHCPPGGHSSRATTQPHLHEAESGLSEDEVMFFTGSLCCSGNDSSLGNNGALTVFPGCTAALLNYK